VNGDNGYIAMQVSGLEVLPGAGLTDSGDTKQLCEACALVGNDLLVALNKSCNTPMTPESFTGVMNSNPMFAAMMAINSIGGTDLYQVYRDAAIDTLSCNEMDSWPERTKIRFQQPDMQKVLALKVSARQQKAN
jgi:hypothetical protein